MKFYGDVLVVQWRTLNFGGDLGLLRWVNEQKTPAVAWSDRGAGNDPEPLRLAFHHKGSTFITSLAK